MQFPSVQHALSILLSNRELAKPSLTREMIMAYCTLKALDHYWPSRSAPELKALLVEFFWIRDQELDRYLKQRRIAATRLIQEIAAVEQQAS
ncbi:MAG: hypothetical protein H7222_06250 [Methylotenera sp.]|nr:hypothetical protein [Oligoflexia bacterium]